MLYIEAFANIEKGNSVFLLFYLKTSPNKRRGIKLKDKKAIL